MTSGPVTPQWPSPSWPEPATSSPSTTARPGLLEADGNSGSCPLWGWSARRNVCAAGLKAPATSRAVPASAARLTRLPLGLGTREGAACRLRAPRCGKTLRYAPSPEAPPAASLPARGSAQGAAGTASLREAPHARPRREGVGFPCRLRGSHLGPPSPAVGPLQVGSLRAEAERQAPRSGGCRICGKARFVQSWPAVGAGRLARHRERETERWIGRRAAVVTPRDGFWYSTHTLWVCFFLFAFPPSPDFKMYMF